MCRPSSRQARWSRENDVLEPTVFELSSPGKEGFTPPKLSIDQKNALERAKKIIPQKILRKQELNLPELTEGEVAKHYIRLSQMNMSVDIVPYPLGSCTMKYTPRLLERISHLADNIHPHQPADTVQGLLKILYELEKWLCEITGMHKFTLQPAAGAQGELTGVHIIRAYHRLSGEGEKRKEILIPDTAHGTNPASAAMGGFRVVTIPTTAEGTIDIDALEAVISDRVAGAMITVPNTLGIFERDILRVNRLVHEYGGLTYMDGANMNALLCVSRPADMGFDMVHLNLHKTFGAPHGGGGPGAGPLGVVKKLAKFLPVPTIESRGGQVYLNYDIPHSIGKVRSFYGNIGVLLKAYTYIMLMGYDGLKAVSEIAVLNANYLMKRILEDSDMYLVKFGEGVTRKHEFVLSLKKFRKHGVTAFDVAKRLLDYSLYPPIVYFPPIVEESMMIEPTESMCLEELDTYADALIKIGEEAKHRPEILKGAPHRSSVRRIDEVKASRIQILSWRQLRKVARDEEKTGLHGDIRLPNE